MNEVEEFREDMGIPAPPKKYHRSDTGNAQRFADMHTGKVLFCHSDRTWYIWDGRCWRLDQDGGIRRLAQATVREMYAEAVCLEDQKARKAAVGYALSCESQFRLKAMASLAESAEGLARTRDQFDNAAYKLNCENGTIDLKSGELLPHRAEDMITRITPVAYDPEARCSLWDNFLERVLPDPEVRAFLPRAAGYSICGDPREEKIFFPYGPPASGKSTLIAAVGGALGDGYITTADFESFLQRDRASGSPRSDIARLAGSRLVTSIEVQEGKRLAESLVCQIAGGDKVAARHLYKESFEFKPTFTLWLVANHRPYVSSNDSPVWRRILHIPFDQAISPKEQDPQVKALLCDPEYAGPAVLAWIVEGALSWQREGLDPPPAVLALTEEYRQESDPLEDFIEERCVVDPAARVSNQELRAAYSQWAEASGEKFPLGSKQLTQALRSRGLEEHRTGAGRYWTGLGLRRDE